jgi:hypothetical protein
LRSLVTGGAGRPGPGPIVTDPRHSAADPFISIVVATYNSGRHLAACLESITRQDFRSFELIVIDGGSTDDTLEIADRYRDRIAYLVSEPDRGIYHAWNKALAVLRGTWVLFIGSDDRLASPGVLGAAVPWLESADSSTRIVYGSIRLTDDGRDTGQVLGLPWSEARPLLRSWMSIPHPATFHHRALFRDHGVFDESFAIAGDYEFVLRELLTAEAAFIPELVVVEMGIGGIPTTSSGSRSRRSGPGASTASDSGRRGSNSAFFGSQSAWRSQRLWDQLPRSARALPGRPLADASAVIEAPPRRQSGIRPASHSSARST